MDNQQRRYDDLPPHVETLDRVAINARSHKLLARLLSENPRLREILRTSSNEVEALVGIEKWVSDELGLSPAASAYYHNQESDRASFESVPWRDYAAIRLLDYIKNAGRTFPDLNLRSEVALNDPIRMIWLATRYGTGGAKPGFFEDMLHLFRQLRGEDRHSLPDRARVEEWMERWPSGLDPRIVRLREENRTRIINLIIDRIDRGDVSKKSRFRFDEQMTRQQKFDRAEGWWHDHRFHLAFAVRTPDLLNQMLGDSLDPDTMKLLYSAEKAGIPFFVNPHYLSLLNVRTPSYAIGADQAIRDYVLYSRELIEEFGHIVAWEKEDKVEPGKPNAAGWLLPTHDNVHRRYPEVAILIPDTVGRACGGLCASCQRMYDFQSGHLNFDLDRLEPKESWADKLRRLMDYFENDSQLRDILITGGDALMSSDRSLEKIFDAVVAMALRKREANKSRPDGEKYAEIVRVRLGTRLPVYLPQRITDDLIKILADFRARAFDAGIRQFVVQTHFQSPLEVTPESAEAIRKIIAAGWIVTNQHVMTAASSRRGHSTRLRQLLNDIGVLCYYTFTVKGYMENRSNFATNGRAVQEEMEEKLIGELPEHYRDRLTRLPDEAERMIARIDEIRKEAGVPFLATDRNVLNLPGVGKSLSFRVIGVTRYGRRILEFDHDSTRRHSPVINTMGKIVVIESRSISEYLDRLRDMGEEISEYDSLWGYSIGETEARAPLYEYPEYDFDVTEKLTNFAG